jgi:hypothetical protein
MLEQDDRKRVEVPLPPVPEGLEFYGGVSIKSLT